MCGIFGLISVNDTIETSISKKQFNTLVKLTERRGKDSSGFCYGLNSNVTVKKYDERITKSLHYDEIKDQRFVFGHSRLITNGLNDNQPVCENKNVLVHNGIIINHEELFKKYGLERSLEIDTEIISSLFHYFKVEGFSLENIITNLLREIEGTFSCILLDENFGLVAFSNNGSLYYWKKRDKIIFASERYFLSETFQLCPSEVHNINNGYLQAELSNFSINSIDISSVKSKRLDLIPSLGIRDGRESILKYEEHSLKRCSKCILPETMPFITFNENGVCNYCSNYTKVNQPKNFSEFERLVEPYRRESAEDCIIPLSGGRDSIMGLHIAVKELGLKPITYTYDWGMVTDLARRNISRVTSSLGVENIVVADDIAWKRKNVRKNLIAWLRQPDLGMLNLLMAGDKHFFRHVENVKKETGISLNLWSINPLEVTHFKSGFIGVPPDFASSKVYNSGLSKQWNYHKRRFAKMYKNPSYFNSTLYDTYLGEYYRSFYKKSDYFHVFDYWKWDESEINDIIINQYGFELAPDSISTWRIGDGTAAFYNYVYYLVAGFTEHDTFRSNQIREGQITREDALELVKKENIPRFENMVWYLEALGLDFREVIKVVNEIPSLY